MSRTHSDPIPLIVFLHPLGLSTSRCKPGRGPMLQPQLLGRPAWKLQQPPAIISTLLRRAMADARDVKRREKESYDSIAAAYDAVYARYNARFASDMVDLLYPQNNEQGLDVAGGSGSAGLKLAERIGPGGSVVIVDLAPEMLRLAKKNADERMLDTVRTLVMDAEALEFPDNFFNIVTCSFGVMSFPNVTTAISEMARVLKPGGRIGLTVWSIPERCPFYSAPMTAFVNHAAPLPLRAILKTPLIGRRVLRTILLSGSPFGYSPARFCKDGSLEKHLLRAGFRSVRRLKVAHALEFRSIDEYWDALMEASPGVKSGPVIPPGVLASIREDLRQLVSPRTGEVRLFNEAAIILATKPASDTPDNKRED